MTPSRFLYVFQLEIFIILSVLKGSDCSRACLESKLSFQARVLFGLIVLIQITLLIIFRYLQKPALKGMNQCLSVVFRDLLFPKPK